LAIRLHRVLTSQAEYERWKLNKFNIEHQEIPQNYWTVLAKYKISSISDTDIIFGSKQLPDSEPRDEFFKYISYSLVDLNDISKNSEGIFTDPALKQFSQKPYNYAKIKRGREYLLIVSVNPNYNAAEGSFEFSVNSKDASTSVEPVSVLPTMEFFDFFKPNKYGVILRERLFVNDQNNFVSIKFKLGRVMNPPPKEDLKTMTTTRTGGKQVAPAGTTARAGAQGGATTRQGGVGATARGGAGA
jgi:hypothetical protein